VSERRVLKVRSGPGTELGSLELVEEELQPAGPDEITVRVEVALLDPLAFSASAEGAAPEASFTGVIAEAGAEVSEGLTVGQTVIGAGPPGDLVRLPASRVRQSPDGSGMEPHRAAAMPYLSSLQEVLDEVRIEPEDRVLVSGHAAIRQMSAFLLAASGHRGSPARLTVASGTTPEGPFDVLVHGLVDSPRLQDSLSTLRIDGRAHILVPPGSHALELDFYPHIHRSSLELLIRRVGPAWANSGDGQSALVLGEGGIDIESMLVQPSDAEGLDGFSLDEVARAEKLLAVDWR
jgi:hypothetical protein